MLLQLLLLLLLLSLFLVLFHLEQGLKMHTKPWVRARARRGYWENMQPASKIDTNPSLIHRGHHHHHHDQHQHLHLSGGRPHCPALSCPDNWGVTAGDKILHQQKEATRAEQIAEVEKIQMEKLKI